GRRRGPPRPKARGHSNIPEREARGPGPAYPARPRGEKAPPAAGRRLPESTPAEIAAHDRADRLPSLAVEALHSHLLDRIEISFASVDLDAGQQHTEFEIFQT